MLCILVARRVVLKQMGGSVQKSRTNTLFLPVAKKKPSDVVPGHSRWFLKAFVRGRVATLCTTQHAPSSVGVDESFQESLRLSGFGWSFFGLG